MLNILKIGLFVTWGSVLVLIGIGLYNQVKNVPLNDTQVIKSVIHKTIKLCGMYEHRLDTLRSLKTGTYQTVNCTFEITSNKTILHKVGDIIQAN